MSDSQDEQIEDILKYEVANPLIYKEFDYDQTEWDNIPTILPRFITFMSKHLEALTNKCHERFTQISTPDLQAEVDKKLFELETKLDNSNKLHQEERGKLSNIIKSLESRIDNFLEEASKKEKQQSAE
jgi:hypothetical protein